MKKLLLALSIAAATATPAFATGGMTCRTAGSSPVEATVGFGHTPGAGLILTRLVADGRSIPVKAPQWWLDNDELRLLLTDPDEMRREVIIKARRNGHVYDGSLWRDGVQRWVRCRES